VDESVVALGWKISKGPTCSQEKEREIGLLKEGDDLSKFSSYPWKF